MKIKKNVVVPTNIGNHKLGEASLAVKNFYESDDESLMFECDDKPEATKVYSTVSGFINRYKLPLKVQRNFNDIYVTRRNENV